LYDLTSDHDEVINLADSPAHQGELARMRMALQEWEHRIRDVGFLSEWEMNDRSKRTTPYDMGHDEQKYDFDAVFAAANLATSLQPSDLPDIIQLLNDKDSAVRYWGAIGLLTQGKAGVAAGHDELVAALNDESPIVRITAAEALGRYGNEEDTAASLKVLLHFARPEANAFLSLAAWNALDYLDERARPAVRAIRELSPDPTSPPPRYGDYGRRLKQKTLADLL
jgi:uncharacterized sulfatase